MSTIKVDTINTRTGSGNITFSRPTVLTAGDIITADIANDAVTTVKIVDDAVTSVKIVDDAVTIAKLAATGTASASTFLRGDNSWQAAGGGITTKVLGGSYNMSTTGTIVVTGVGFRPTALLFFLHKDGNPAASWGLVSSTVTDDGNIHAMGHTTAHNSAGDLWTLYTGGSDIAKGVLTSYDADGATFTRSKTGSPTGTAYYKVLYMK